MIQNKSKISPQVLYQGRYVDKDHFRVFVYNGKTQKLANSYEEFETLISSGLWFETKEGALAPKGVKEKARKLNHGSNG